MKEENARKWKLMNTSNSKSPKELSGEYHMGEACIFDRGGTRVLSAELIDANTGEIVYMATSSKTILDDYANLINIMESEDRVYFEEGISRKSGRTFYRMMPVL